METDLQPIKIFLSSSYEGGQSRASRKYYVDHTLIKAKIDSARVFAKSSFFDKWCLLLDNLSSDYTSHSWREDDCSDLLYLYDCFDSEACLHPTPPCSLEELQLLLFAFFSFVVDTIASYCRELEKEREKADSERIALALRATHRMGTGIKLLLSPVRLFPRSIHPIEAAA